MKKILFVCLGNICRSPAAEGIFKAMVEKEGLSSEIYVDSAGTIGFHAGELPDLRMRSEGAKRGYNFNSRARQFSKDDFKNFDFICVMDKSNYKNVLKLDEEKKYTDKVCMMTSFAENRDEIEVPDPYYEGLDGFNLVLDILEDSCKGLLNQLLTGPL